MKHQLISLAVAALCFTACTNEDHISQDPLADTPIKLNVSVTNPTTRAGYSNELKPDAFWLMVYHDDQSNDKYNYDIFAEKVGDTWKTYDLMEYVNNNSKTEVTMLWANMTDPVTVNAYVNNNQIESVDLPTDQSDVEQLKKADILYMPITPFTPNKAGINVEFQHITSKINLTIELGSEYQFTDKIDQKITDVKIGGTIAQISYGDDGKGNVIIGAEPEGKVKSITPLCTALYLLVTMPEPSPGHLPAMRQSSFRKLSPAVSSMSPSRWMAKPMTGATMKPWSSRLPTPINST